MITIRRSQERGHADHGWLRTFHTFSFADYYDPEFMGFGCLRVINQDQVAVGRGFATHGHKDMEIVSYVLEGALEHEDSMGNGSRMRPGDVQLMSAGSGVTHSEFNPSSTEPLEFLQMWIYPRTRCTEPRYEQRAFSESERRGRLRLVVSPDGRDGSVTIGQDARLYAAILGPGDRTVFELPAGRMAWLHVARGELSLNGEQLSGGDGAAIRDERSVEIAGIADAELVLWELLEDEEAAR
jgi:redox-sensitive bicupin YhaK (pirin superfamily)